MADGPSFNLVNLEGLSEPATKLVEAVSSAIGTLYAPFGIVRQAKADAKATIIRAEAKAEAASLTERTASRIAYREALRQQNIEKIVSLAAQELPEQVSNEPVNPDWTLQYLDYAQDVSDDEMQTLWARILAGEVTEPGTYSKRTLSFLRTLDKQEAVWFTEFCSLALRDAGNWPFILQCHSYWAHYRNKFNMYDVEEHFTAIGLLLTDVPTIKASDLNGRLVSYFGKIYQLAGPIAPSTSGPVYTPDLDASFTLPKFTAIGSELAGIAGASPIPNYIENLSELMPQFGIAFVPVD